jgi:uncharacterized membrane protein YkoI
MSKHITKIVLALAALAVLAFGGAALAGAASGGDAARPTATQSADDDRDDADEREQPVARADAERARDAAVKAVGGGRAGEVERTDDRGAEYEVEVTTSDGRDVDVELDRAFAVVSTADEGRDDDDGAEDRD